MQQSIGYKGIQILKGQVKNNNSPLKDGRVQVRIPGMHPWEGDNSDPFEVVNDDELPWIEVMGGKYLQAGVGSSEVPQVDAWVYVLVPDNIDHMIVIGSMKSGVDGVTGVSDVQTVSKGEQRPYQPHGKVTPPQPFQHQGGKPVVSGQNAINELLGFVAGHFESRGDVSTVSTGYGDQGGVSYGTYQLASNTGTMQNYVNSPEGAPYKARFQGLKPGSSQFTQVYKQIAQEDPDAFQMSQFHFIKRTHYDPVERYARSKGVDVNNRRVQEALWSQSVQHGYTGNTIIINNWVNNGLESGGKSDNDINGIYHYRGQYASQFQSQNATINRYAREKLVVIDIPEDTPPWTPGQGRMFSMPMMSPMARSTGPNTPNVEVIEHEELDSKTEYPLSSSYISQSGNYTMIDDTPGNERMKAQHRSGSYFEFRPDGNFNFRSVSEDENIIILEGDLSTFIAGAIQQQIQKSIDSIVQGSVTTKFESYIEGLIQEHIKLKVNSFIDIDSDSDITIKQAGNIRVEADGHIDVDAGGNVSVTAGGNASVTASGTIKANAGSSMSLSAGSSIDISAGGPVNISGSSINLN